jgi:hypothetical protein
MTFEDGSHVREIKGFRNCKSLSRIVIPASVEIISCDAFWDCIQLTEVIFAANSRLREIHGFRRCTSLSRMILPPSLLVIDGTAFLGYAGPRFLQFPLGSQLRNKSGLQYFHCLIAYAEDHLKQTRSRLPIGLSGLPV